MIRNTILATAAAGMLAIGGLAASSVTAAAGPAGAVQFGGQGWNVQIGTSGGAVRSGPIGTVGGAKWQAPKPAGKNCRPVTQNVKWWDKWGNQRWSKVVVRYDCATQRGHRQPGFGAKPSFPNPPRHGGWGGR